MQFLDVNFIVHGNARDVHGHRHFFFTVGFDPVDALLRHGDIKFADQAGFFSKGDVLVRRFFKIAAKAHQGFIVMKCAGVDIKNGVEGDFKITAIDHIAKLVQRRHRFFHQRVHVLGNVFDIEIRARLFAEVIDRVHEALGKIFLVNVVHVDVDGARLHFNALSCGVKHTRGFGQFCL